MNVIVRTEEGAISLIVDDIGDVLDLAPENIEMPPDNLAAEAGELIQSVYKLNNSLLLLLDTDRTIDVGSAY
jgi:purine-binding chemotaxis protein CheW